MALILTSSGSGNSGGSGTIEGSISAGNIPIGVGANTIASSSAIGATLSDASSVGINLNETGVAGLIHLSNSGTAGTTLTDSGGGGVTLEDTSAGSNGLYLHISSASNSGGITVANQGSGGISIENQGPGSGIFIDDTSGGGIDIATDTTAGGYIELENHSPTSGATGGFGILIKDASTTAGISIDAQGAGAVLSLNPSGKGLKINGVAGVSAGPFTTITSITVVNGIVTALTGA